MRTALLAFMAIAFISCNTTDGGRPFKSDIKTFKNPYITGEITNIGWRHIGQDSLFTILVEENPDVHEPLEEGGEKISLSLWKETEIFIRKKDGNTYYANKDDLKVGQNVRAWLMVGTVLTSYPSQAGAKQILVFEE